MVTKAGFQTYVNNFAGNCARAFVLPPKRFDCHPESNDMHIYYARSGHDLDLTLGQPIFYFDLIWSCYTSFDSP